MKYKLPVKLDKGNGEVIVLLHGLGNNYKSWTYVLKEIDYSKYRVIALDLLGFGAADKPKLKYSSELQADAVIGTLKSLKIKTAILVGHSMGCNISIEVAKKEPKIVKQLILLGAPLYEKIPKGNIWSKITRAEGAYFTIFSFVRNNPDLTIKAAKTADKLVPLIKGMQITESTWPAYKSSLANTIMQTKSYSSLTDLKVPALLVYGKLDTFVIKRTLKKASRKNKKYIKFISVMGPHEITPLQGKKISEIINEYTD